MTYPPTPGPDGTYPVPPDPPVQPYQQPQNPAYPQYGQPQNPYPQPPNPFAPQPQPGQPPYDYGYQGSPYAYSPYTGIRRPTDGLAIASLVVSIVSVLGLCAWWIGGVLGILGAIFGHVARRRMRTTGASGAGMALAGIIIGWVVAAIAIIGAVVVVIALAHDSGSSGNTF
ncbi:DUF4190 domain-containing protein [Actinoplanes sp. TFC3]|uniref:DUF4190 domain-containing protein n=1 Tax=Actinoplanes sp. TFC3 TaxID=1710355 RepID=UPI0008308611|nr:DUF4190 domain-containing protein [Actinoplanes sp. TFC3]